MKIKNILILMPAFVGAVAFTGCKKDYLDAEPTEFATPEQIKKAVEKDPNLLSATIAGVYTSMYNTGTGGTTNHDDFGQKGWDIYADMLASDMVLGAISYGWYANVIRYLASVNYTLDQNYMPWRYYYRLGYNATYILDEFAVDKPTDDDAAKKLKRHIRGQAKAMRAYTYFYLTQFYAKGYGDGTAKILPIYKTYKGGNQPRSTTKEVYDFIIEDLTSAITDLVDFNRSSKEKINVDVAKGLLAYVLAARGTPADLAQVVSLTNDIIAKYPITTATETVAELDPDGLNINPGAGFNNVGTPSWIWGVDLTLSSGLDLVSWWGQVDVFTYSYAWAGNPKLIDAGLYAAIPNDDIRKNQFDGGYPVNKFFAPDRIEGGQRNVVTDYLYMRTDEFVLLNAETKARLGQDGPARDILKELVSKRGLDVSYIDALSGQALQDEIYLQTRIELWGEGKVYLAMKRLKHSVTRGANHLYFAGQTFAWDSQELTFPIPQAEILNNPLISQ